MQDRVEFEACSFASSTTHPGEVRGKSGPVNVSTLRERNLNVTNLRQCIHNLNIRPLDYAKLLQGKDLSYFHSNNLSFMKIRVSHMGKGIRQKDACPFDTPTAVYFDVDHCNQKDDSEGVTSIITDMMVDQDAIAPKDNHKIAADSLAVNSNEASGLFMFSVNPSVQGLKIKSLVGSKVGL